MIFWQSGAHHSGIVERKQMITADHPLPISTQAKLLNISRGTVYYLPKPTSEKDLALMRQLDELHLQHPTMGARMLRDQLNRQGLKVGRRHVSTLMKKMGMVPLSCQKNTSAKHPRHKIYPYLLRVMKIDRANQVWALDTTYIPMAKGFDYFDWYNTYRPHSRLEWLTPQQKYVATLPKLRLTA